jgi:hypothetical protein
MLEISILIQQQQQQKTNREKSFVACGLKSYANAKTIFICVLYQMFVLFLLFFASFSNL